MKGKGREEGKWAAATDPIFTLNQLTAHGAMPSPTPAAAECQEWRISEARRLEPPRSSDGASQCRGQPAPDAGTVGGAAAGLADER